MKSLEEIETILVKIQEELNKIPKLQAELNYFTGQRDILVDQQKNEQKTELKAIPKNA